MGRTPPPEAQADNAPQVLRDQITESARLVSEVTSGIIIGAVMATLLFVLHPMLRRGFRHDVNGALEALPCVGMQFRFFLFVL